MITEQQIKERIKELEEHKKELSEKYNNQNNSEMAFVVYETLSKETIIRIKTLKWVLNG